MANRPPGYEQAAEDVVCYNCGVKGHIFFACPEDTRTVPAGLEASRKRQASGNDYHAPTKRSKGPVVTHYPPPPPPSLPHIPPPPITYSPRPGYEALHPSPLPGPPPGPPYHIPPHPGHYDQHPSQRAGRSASRGLPHSTSRDIHEPSFQGPHRAPPNDSQYRPPHYDRYDQHRLGPPPYSRPYSAPPNRYDEQYSRPALAPPYATVHGPPHQAPFEHYPPAPGVDSYFSGPPQPYPPPPSTIPRASSQHGYGDIPQALHYAPVHGPPPVGNPSYQSHHYPSSDMPPYHARYDERFADRPSYEPQRRDHHHQHRDRRPGENRHNRERHGRRRRGDSPKGRSRSERRDDDFSWEEEAIFREAPVKTTRDLIREPLPAEWTDDPIMPPKYDKETITSRYINSTNVDDFALSVRETKAWQIVQLHPAFLAPTDVRIEKLWEYERALNLSPGLNKQNRPWTNTGTSGRQREKSSIFRTRRGHQPRYSQYHGENHLLSEDHRSQLQITPRDSEWEKTSYRDVKESEGERTTSKKPKIHSPEPGEVSESDDAEILTAVRSSSPSWEEKYHHVRRDYQKRDMHSMHDSRGAVSGGGVRLSCSPVAITPPRPTSQMSGSSPRASSTRSSHNDLSKPPSRRSSRSNPSQPSSRRNSMGSPLTPTERELLGMLPYSSDSDTGQESSIRQSVDAPKRQRQRPAKLHAAYQRRW
ncbi:hypothetical protein NPX13_g4333 [Xylaria arbuscula]|uniref:CCHC-type domain-containing protein n=1 Tax=Xylaria arbuscula TaxID=114810 RepID=A0A9W8TMB7_9PEZI|nr:hypothetical protein NPX13_g4333 [Xylaria arbuscula]